MALPVSNLVNVIINLSPLAAVGRNFGVLNVAGDSSVISGLERIREYQSLAEVAADFGTTAPEYNAAALYFGQVPQPKTLMISRWIRVASAAQNDGGILSASQQAITNFNTITNGGFVIVIDGVTKTLTGLDFSAATNLNAVAAVINGVLTGGVCTWNGSQFIITSNSAGAGVKASGTITLGSNPANNDTLTVDGTLITFVTATATGSQVHIGATAQDTSANLQAFLQASVDANISLATYATNSGTGVTTVTYKLVGTAGNSFTLAKSSTAITLSAGTLAGGAPPSSVGYATVGTGTDISSLLRLTSALAVALVPGYDAETPVACVALLDNLSPDWYGIMFQASVQPTDQQSLDVSTYIEGALLSRTYGVTIINTNVLSPLVSNDLASLMKGAGYLKSLNQYSQNPYAIASFFGRAFSVDFTQNNSTITLMYKQEPSVTPENLTISQAATLQSKRCNVFVDYVNDTQIIQYGMMSGSAFFDEVQDLDWLKDDMQTSVYNVLYTSPTKVPQTDAGVNQLVNAIAGSCSRGVNNGLIAAGTWTGPSFGSLQSGQFLKTGFYIFAQSVALQSQGDREARIAPPIQVAVKLAGAIQQVNITVNVNR